jgi:hypothetical protein
MTANDHLTPGEKEHLAGQRRAAYRRVIVTLAVAVLLPALVYLAWRARRET